MLEGLSYQVHWYHLDNSMVRGLLLDSETRESKFESLQDVEAAIEKDRQSAKDLGHYLCGYIIYEVIPPLHRK